MRTEQSDLDRLLDLTRWQPVQDELAKTTGLAIVTVDYFGRELTRHSARSPFCDACRGESVLRQHCRKCDSRGGLEAARQNAPYLYLCHAGIVDMAIPIISNGRYLGAVMAGQVRLTDGEDKLEQIFTPPKSDAALPKERRELFNALPTLSLQEVSRAADMIFVLVQYIIGVPAKRDLPGTARSLPPVKYPKSLKPALDYIRENTSGSVTLRQMAELCHLSVSHFSRLFSREVGLSFSAYLAKIRLEQSKQLLTTTDMTVSRISEELGFNEPGYFIKTFKKHTGTTPAVFRKLSDE